MPILSYLVFPAAGAAGRVVRQLSALPGCEVTRAEHHDLLILVTETSGDAEEQALRASLAGIDEVRSLSLAFGELAR